MVAVIPAAPASAAAAQPRSSKSPSIVREDAGVSSRPPLNPSEKDNAAVLRRPRQKEVTSRYLSSYSSPSSSTTSTSSSSSARTGTTTTSSSSSSSSNFRRCPSPLPASRPSTPSSSFSHSTGPKRSQSVDRTRPATPRSDPGRLNNVAATETAAAKALCTTTRSLSVSFQGGSFFYQTSKAKSAMLNPARKSTPERRRTSTTPLRNNRPDGEGKDVRDHQSENSRPAEHLRWPGARTKQSNPLSRSLDYSSEKKDSLYPSARLLQHSMILDEGRRASFDVGDLSASSDTDSVSSGSNSGAYESYPHRARVTPRGINVPARFWQENGSKLRRTSDLASPIAAPLPRTLSASKLYPMRKSLGDGLPSSPITSSSPLRGPVRPSSPSRIAPSPSRGISSPLRTRNNGQAPGPGTIGQPSIAPSMIDFVSDLRRSRKGELRIEEAHLLRLLHNRHLQWRHVNARANSLLSVQKIKAERIMYSASMTIADMRDSNKIKRIKLQLLVESLKLSSILRGQVAYLEEWSFMEEEHSSSLSGAIEALRGCILRLPVVAGARADIQDVKDAVGSAVDVMQAMGSSISAILSKVKRTCSLVGELAKVAAQEQALLDQSRDLLCAAAAMHVKQCSLRGHLLQLRHTAA